MRVYHVTNENELNRLLEETGCYRQKGDFTHLSTRSQLVSIFPALPEGSVVLELEDQNPQLQIRYDKDLKGFDWPHAYGCIRKNDILRTMDHLPDESVHVLLCTSMIDEKWIRPWMKKLIRPTDRVCVLAMSYFDDTKTEADWNCQYSPVNGQWYRSNTDVFFPYGLKREQIVWVNPFKDSISEMQNKIQTSSILMLTGGAPDLYMQRIRKNRLKKILKKFKGLVIGYSAGAMIQLDDYHISVDPDYDHFSWQKGLGRLSGFDIEVHYTGNKDQKEGIEKTLQKNQVPVYALYEDGALVVDAKGKISCHGKTELFLPEDDLQ